ncbi:MAG TPA: PAS domain S-box protein [Acidimicrobiales bacterium]|nr:PAS domain S-box protein [Acidimicrobiales bacterium]
MRDAAVPGLFELPVTDSVYSHWQQAFVQSSIPTAIASTDRHPVWANDAYVRMLGYTREQLTSLKSFADITHPDDVASDEKLHRGLLGGNRENYDREKRFLHADGHVVPARVFTTAVRDGSGSLVALLAQAIDLTEQKRAEAERRHATRLTQIAFEQSPIATAILATDSHPLWANDAYIRLLGITREKLLASDSLAEFTHTDDLARDQELFDELVAGTRQTLEREKRYLHADGHVVPARVFVAAMRDESGSIVSLVTQAIDLTDQRQVEEELRDATRFTQVLFAQSSIAAGAIDLEGRVVATNDTLVRLSGYTREQLIGSTFTDHLHPEDIAAQAQGLSEYIAGTRDRDELEIRLRHADGHFVPTLLSSSALRDDSGSLVGIVGQYVDLTEQKRVEAERETEARLRQLLLDQSPISAAIADLQGRIQMVNDTLARVSGYSRDELIGSSFAEYLHPDDLGPQAKGLSEYIAGTRDSDELEVRLRHGDGHFIPCRMYTSAVRDDAGSLIGIIGQFVNLTVQKQAEEELRHASRFTEVLFTQSSIAAGAVDLEGRVVAANDRLVHMSGYSRDELVGVLITDHLHPDDVAALAQGLSEYIAGTRDRDELEVRLRHGDGHLVPTLMYTSALRDDSGSLVGVIGQMFDLTQQKRVEAEREAEARFRQLLFDQSFIAAGAIDLQGRLVSANDTTCRLFGYTREELIGSSFAAYIHPDDVAAQAQGLSEYVAGTRDRNELEIRFRHADGHFVPCQMYTTGMHDDAGSLVGVIGQILDLTEQKRVEAERETEARLRQLLLDQSPIPAAIVDLQGRVQLVNDAVALVSGYSRKQMIGSPITGFLHPDDVGALAQGLSEYFAGTRDRDELEVRFLHADGHVMPARLYSSAMRDEAGSLIGVIGQVLDLTEQKQAEEEREREARFRQLLLDQSPIPAGVFDLQGRVQLVNDATCRLLGRTSEELTGSSYTSMALPEDIEPLTASFADLVAGTRENEEFHLRLVHSDGHAIPGRIFGEALRDDLGSVVAVIAQFLDESELQRAEEEREREARFRQLLLDQGPVPAAVVDLQTHLQLVNDAACRLFGHARGDLIGSSFMEFVHSDDVNALARGMSEFIAGTRDSDELEVRLRHADGHYVPCQMYTSGLHDDSGSLVAIIGQILDLTEKKRAEEEREAEARLRQLLFDQGPIPVAICDLEARLQMVNDATCRLVGRSHEELVGSSATDFIHPDDLDPLINAFADIVSGKGEHTDVPMRCVHSDGRVMPGRIFGAPLRDDSGTVVAVIGQFLDESELRRVEEQLEFEELHDPLTSLPTRSLVTDRVGREVEWARARHRFVGIAIVDIDRFDGVNETFGHALGDKLLVDFAQRLVACSERTDTVGRLESDKFTIVRGALTDPLVMIDLAHEIEESLGKHFVLDNEPLLVTASIGIALSSKDETAERLLRDAELAVGQAKEDGGNCTVVFDEALRARAQTRSAAEAGLRDALQNGEFVLYYQPIINLALGKFIGTEALIRWNDPQRGLVLPEDFIATAEETELIVPIGEWVLNEACRQTSAWNADWQGNAPLEIAVNVSPHQVRAGSLLETVTRALDSSGLDPRVLTLELTETTFMENLELVHQVLDPLHELGVKMAIDDFGTGYSSLGRIRRFGIDILKIDRSFVSGLEDDESARHLAKAVLEMGRALDVLVIAEGVETMGQLEWLGRFGCRFAQGFLFAHPLPPDRCLTLLCEY